MPGSPRIDKGEGFIRSHELLQHLREDIDSAYAKLEEDRESQYLRRCVVRAIFSYIEALVECVKVETRSSIRTDQYVGELTDKEKETLGPLAVIGAKLGKIISLEQNIKRTFRLATKVWGIKDFRLDTGGSDFKDFLTAKSARNRLTHPRTFYDIEVTDFDMHCHTIAGMWTQAEFQRLFKARESAMIQSLPERDREVFVGHLERIRARKDDDV